MIINIFEFQGRSKRSQTVTTLTKTREYTVVADSIIPAQGSSADFAPRFLCHIVFQYCVGFPDYENCN